MISRLIHYFFILLLLAEAAYAEQAPVDNEQQQSYILYSDEKSLFKKVALELSQQLQAIQHIHTTLKIDASNLQHNVFAALDAPKNLLITFGEPIFNQALQSTHQATIINIFSSNSETTNNTSTRGHSIELGHSPSDKLQTIAQAIENIQGKKLLLPYRKKYAQLANRYKDAALQQGLQFELLQINDEELADNSALIRQFKTASKTSHLIIALPDNKLYNRKTITGIMLGTYRRRAGIIGFGQAYHKAGAVLSIYPEAEAIAKDIASHIPTLLNAPNNQTLKLDALSFKVNRKIANSLNIKTK